MFLYQLSGCHIYVSRPDKDWITIANPAVSIAGVEGILNLDVIDLPDFKSSDLPSIESSADYPLFSEWIKSDENALLNTTSLDNGMCDGLPDFRNPLPWDENGSMTGTFPSIFAKSVDSEDGSDVVFVYDRHLTLFENTVENPVSTSFLKPGTSQNPQFRTRAFACIRPAQPI